MAFGTWIELVEHICLTTIVLELYVGIVLKLVFTSVVLNFSKKTTTVVQEMEKQEELVLLCPKRNDPFIGSCILEFTPCIETPLLFQIISLSFKWKNMLYDWVYDQTMKLLCMLNIFTLLWLVSKGWTVSWCVGCHPKFLGNWWNLTVDLLLTSVMKGITVWPSVTKCIKIWAWHFGKLLSENKLTTLCQTSQQALEIT